MSTILLNPLRFEILTVQGDRVMINAEEIDIPQVDDPDLTDEDYTDASQVTLWMKSSEDLHYTVNMEQQDSGIRELIFDAFQTM